MRPFIDVITLVFGVDDLLAAIETVITGDHIGKGDGQKVVHGAFVSEQFQTDQKRGDGTVGDATE